MSQMHQFKFIAHTGNEGSAPLDLVYPRILKNLDISIITQLQYKLEACVSDEVFNSFIKFLNLESIPEITVKNVSDFILISQELKFRELEMLIEKFLKEKKECDDIIQQLINSEACKDTSVLEKIISSHLDFYIENHPNLLSQLKLTTLFNIFNSKERILRNEGNALLFLMNLIEKGKHDFAVLLPSINGEKIDQKLIQTVINSDFFNDNDFSPNIRNQSIRNFFSLIDETKKSQEKFETYVKKNFEEVERKLNEKIQQSINNLSSVINKLHEKIDEFEDQQNKKVDLLNQKFEEKINEMNKRIDDLSKKVDNVVDDLSKKVDNVVDDLSKKVDNVVDDLSKKVDNAIDDLSKKVDNAVDDLSKKVDNAIDDLSKKVDSVIENHDKKINDLSNDVELIKKVFEFNGLPIDKFKILNDGSFAINKMITQPLPLIQTEKNSKEGILSCLKRMENGFNDHKFISILSSRDPYNLLLPDSKDYYYSSSDGCDFFVEIEFDSNKIVNGIILQSHNSKFIKGFKVIVDEINEVFSTDGIEQLKKNYEEVKIHFNSCDCKKIKIMQNGPNFNGTNFIRLQRFDVITEDKPDGYFKSIINNYNDVHLLPVKLKLNLFSAEDFHLIDSKHSISIWVENGIDGFFETQFINGFAFIESYRLKRNSGLEKMKAWEIHGQQKDDGEWIKLDWRNDNSELNYPLCEVFELKVKTIVKRIKIVQTKKTFGDKCILRFNHFDIFGRYYFLN